MRSRECDEVATCEHTHTTNQPTRIYTISRSPIKISQTRKSCTQVAKKTNHQYTYGIQCQYALYERNAALAKYCRDNNIQPVWLKTKNKNMHTAVKNYFEYGKC